MGKIFYTVFLAGAVLSSCCSPARFFDRVYDSGEKNLTLGLVQREIRVGLTQAEVAVAIGSPNIVSKDQADRETWIYDRIATEVRRSSSSGLCLFLARGCDDVHRTDTTQKTLTVVIKFDCDGLVADVKYHASKF